MIITSHISIMRLKARTIINTTCMWCFACLLLGCASSTEYGSIIARDGSFSAYDEQFRVDPNDYPVYGLVDGLNRAAPSYGVNQSSGYIGIANPDFLSSDRWLVTHRLGSQYLMYSETYDHRFCVLRASPPLPPFKRNADHSCTENQGNLEKIYLYVRPDGSAYGWQFLRNPHLALFSERKSWFRTESAGDWSGQPWFKCVERCDKLVNMK